ncbi:MAG: aromatic-ring-hydroxylating dioxygenase subunit beta [Alphaproteobacteria bacterium]|nr:aromatic-ring-hydroxylating dioxygenase subunit beta [Alphaproteobacteria bacterium]
MPADTKARERKPSATLSPEALAAVTTIVLEEARLLDEARYEDWLALYADDAYYWAPHRPEQTDPLGEISIFYDDRMLMEARVRRLVEGKAHAMSPPVATVRVVSGTTLEGTDNGGKDVVVRSKFVMLEHRLGDQRLHGGTARHCLRRVGSGWRIAWKRVDLVNADGVLETISVPF